MERMLATSADAEIILITQDLPSEEAREALARVTDEIVVVQPTASLA